jgi:hypothetical protein
METDALIQTLSRDPKVKGPAMKTWLAICISVALAYSVLAILVVAGARPGFAQHAPWVAAKVGLSLMFALTVAPLLLRLLVGCAMTVGGSLAGIADGERMRAFTGGGFPICAVVIPTMAAPSAAALFMWLRRQAPTRPALAGAAAGTLAGALAAMAYALTCPVDSAAFVAMWYPLAIVACAAAGAAVGRLALRW